MKLPKAALATVVLLVISGMYGTSLTMFMCNTEDQYHFSKSPTTMLMCEEKLAYLKNHNPIFRLAPYICGIQAAYDYLNPRPIRLYKSFFSEWFCFAGLVYIHAFGPEMHSLIATTQGKVIVDGKLAGKSSYPFVQLIYLNLVRGAYGTFFSKILERLLSEDIALQWLRPSTYLRAIFSLGIWVPFSKLGFLIYLFHMMVYVNTTLFERFKQGFPKPDEAKGLCYGFGPEETIVRWVSFNVVTLGLTMVVACFMYVLV